MSYQDYYSALDRPEILQIVFYPRKGLTATPPSATDYSIPVAEGISISCRFYLQSQGSPSVLFFHGNGEVVSDYDYTAPVYNELGINLFVADSRGYGSSGGSPTFASMIGDAHTIFNAFVDLLQEGHHTGDFFVMGRSLGSISAIELASSYQEKIKGLVIESGLASAARLLSLLGFSVRPPESKDAESPELAKVRSISLPTLIIHGEHDRLVPLIEARHIFQNLAATDKSLVIIPRAGHNDIMLVGMQQYFAEIAKFVFQPLGKLL